MTRSRKSGGSGLGKSGIGIYRKGVCGISAQGGIALNSGIIRYPQSGCGSKSCGKIRGSGIGKSGVCVYRQCLRGRLSYRNITLKSGGIGYPQSGCRSGLTYVKSGGGCQGCGGIS